MLVISINRNSWISNIPKRCWSIFSSCCDKIRFIALWTETKNLIFFKFSVRNKFYSWLTSKWFGCYFRFGLDFGFLIEHPIGKHLNSMHCKAHLYLPPWYRLLRLIFHLCFWRFAYVDFENADEADKAMKHMDGGQIDGQEISCAPILPQIPKKSRALSG